MLAAQHEMNEMKIKELHLVLQMNESVNFIGLRYGYLTYEEYSKRCKENEKWLNSQIKNL